jgi:hypothetical protein
MKTRITIDFYGDDASRLADMARGVDLSRLLHDVLGQFVHHGQLVEEHAVRRFSSHRTVPEVKKRLKLAEMLQRGCVAIEADR